MTPLLDIFTSEGRHASETGPPPESKDPNIEFTKARVGLLIRFAVIAVLAPAIAWMLARMWGPQVISYTILYEASNSFVVSETHPMELVASFSLGLFASILGLFTVDSRKRYQGVLLTFGTIIGIVTLASQGLLVPNIDFTDIWNIGLLIFGLVFGILIEYPRLHKYWRDANHVGNEDIIFPKASAAVFVFLAVLVLGGLVQSAFAGTWLIFPDVPVSLAFIYVLFGFVKYDSTAEVAVVGPRESGKSLLLLGLFLTYRARGIAGDADGYMEQLVEQADSMAVDDASQPDFPIANTPNLHRLSFSVVSGIYFLKRINIGVTDHPGEILNWASEHLEGGESLSQRLEGTRLEIIQRISGDIKATEKKTLFFHNLANADVMALLLDMERLQDGELDYLKHLMNIGKAARNNGAEVIVVATKCDLFIDEFARDVGLLENPLKNGLDEEFEEEITHQLTNRFDSIDVLVEEIGDGRIYPVYYETESAEMGLQPKLDQYGNLQHHGMDEVANEIERRL